MTAKIFNVTIPESLNDLTLSQWQELTLLDENKDVEQAFYIDRVLSIVYGIKGVKSGKVKSKDIDKLMNAVRKVLEIKPKFINKFKIDGVTYGFVPDFDDITFGEFVDLDEFNKPEDYHKLMSVLFIPIIKQQAGKRYEIEPYEDVGDLGAMPLGVALGAVAFFLTLGSQLTNAILNFLTEAEQVQFKKAITQKNGDGFLASTL